MAKQKSKKRKKEKFNNRAALFMIIFVLAFMAIILNTRIKALQAKTLANTKRLENINKELEKEEQRAAELENKRIYVQTDQYKIEVAKEKLGLVFPDEIIIKGKAN